MSKRSNNWVNAFETWTCPTNVTNTDDADGCDPCGRTYIGNWDHFYCRGPSNGELGGPCQWHWVNGPPAASLLLSLKGR